MQSLNVLLVSSSKPSYFDIIKKSKYLKKLYITSDADIEGAISVQFNTFKQLAQICKALQVDIVLVNDEKYVLEGITNVMKQHFINCFAPTSAWTNLRLSHNFARNLLIKYEINVPELINLPVEFPVIIKGDGILKIANSIQDIIKIKEDAFSTSSTIAKSIFIEKYIDSNKYNAISIFDGKHLLTFPNENINHNLLFEYSSKLENMLVKEKADFIGFFNSKLIEDNNVLYNTGFDFGFKMPILEKISDNGTADIFYICLSALYQKLNEIKL